jgi:glycyl-tRNA synthetase alpha subunit
MIAYEPILGPGNSNPDAWLDFVFLPDVHYYTDCDRLDPDIFGDDPYALFDNTTWEVVIDPLGAELQELFIETVGEEEWEESCEPYVFGAQVHEDGNSPEVSQTHWGWTLEVYGGALGEELLEVEQIAQGANGFFIVQPAILWPL